MANEVQKIPFDSGEIEVVLAECGESGIVIRRVCEMLGIDFSSQLSRLKEAHWTRVVEIPTLANDGKTRTFSCIPVGDFAMWMIKLSAGKVSPELKPRIEKMQKEAVPVLDNHFRKKAPQIIVGDDPMMRQLQILMQQRQDHLDLVKKTDERFVAQEQKIQSIETQLASIETFPQAILQRFPRLCAVVPQITLRQWIQMVMQREGTLRAGSGQSVSPFYAKRCREAGEREEASHWIEAWNVAFYSFGNTDVCKGIDLKKKYENFNARREEKDRLTRPEFLEQELPKLLAPFATYISLNLYYDAADSIYEMFRRCGGGAGRSRSSPVVDRESLDPEERAEDEDLGE